VHNTADLRADLNILHFILIRLSKIRRFRDYTITIIYSPSIPDTNDNHTVFKHIIILLIIIVSLFENGKCGVQNIWGRVVNGLQIRKK
jgi:hypothetical protein